jgi:hypothetical protein
MRATLSPTLELSHEIGAQEFATREVTALMERAALVPYEAPIVDLGAREVVQDEFGPLVLVAFALVVVATVAVVAMVTDSSCDFGFSFGPVDIYASVN